ncbi:MAG: polysaccharide deacetylase family protein [Clostridia bacterium]|nr:polysaccharide deacetylase family protein [Clostridia bacterium]MBR6795434.1 polysaccharide deacetylase family protein [Clostridia bacterium]
MKPKHTGGIRTILFTVVLAALFLTQPISAAHQGWYVKRTSDHTQPKLDAGQQMIEKYDGYYIDRRHGDSCAEKVIYLTFDAGYVNENVLSILDTLKKEKVPAAFFVLQHVLKKNADTVKQMTADGHFVCNHTMRHKDMTKVSREEFVSELNGLADTYRALTGCEMKKYYRPPEGKYSEENLAWAKELGYKTVFWSFAYADWDNGAQPELKRAKKKITDNLHNGAVLLLHPTSKTNALLLPELIREWKAEGYRFGTLDELTAQ